MGRSVLIMQKSTNDHCIKCSCKLVIGVNITQNQVKHYKYTCKTCYNKKQRDNYAKVYRKPRARGGSHCIKCRCVLDEGATTTENSFKNSDYKCADCRSTSDRERHYSKRVGTPEAKAKELARQLKWKADNKGYVNYINKVRQARKKQRTPKWADLDAIRLIYEECAELIAEHGPRSYHVDHIIPLQGKTVSGLHVENNLQILKSSDNLTKSNKYVQQ